MLYGRDITVRWMYFCLAATSSNKTGDEKRKKHVKGPPQSTKLLQELAKDTANRKKRCSNDATDDPDYIPEDSGDEGSEKKKETTKHSKTYK
jgi:hypothetical protein